MSADDVAAIRARADRAAEHVGRLCTKEDRWKMSVPVREDDSDVLLMAVAHEDVPALLDEVERLREKVARWKHAYEMADPLLTDRDRLAATVDRVRGLLEEWEVSSSRPIASAALDWQSRHAAQLRAAIEGTDS